MPSVPTYDGLQVAQQGLPSVRRESIASPDMFGAVGERMQKQGNALQNAGSDLAVVAGRMQDRENADMLFRAETAIKNDYLNFETQVRERRGQNAWGATKDAADWWEKKTKEHGENLGNDVQRRLFSEQAAKMRLSSLDGISKHESDQRRISIGESAQASIVGSINMAAATAANAPRAVASEDGSVKQSFDVAPFKSDLVKRVQVLSNINGWTPEIRAYKEAEYLTNFHKQIIQSLADKDASAARSYFDANKSEINGSEQDTIGRVIKIGETKQAGFDFLARPDIQKLGNEADQVAAARDFFAKEPEKREAVIQEIKTRWTEQRQFREAGQKDAADAAWKAYSDAKNINAVPASVLAAMDGRDVFAIKKHAAESAGEALPKTDWDRYYQLRQFALSNPAGFAQLDLRREFPNLGKAEREGLIDLQSKKPHEIKEVASLENQLSNTHDLMKWGTNDKEKKGLFDRTVQQAISAEQQRVGKPLGYEDRQKIIDRMLVEGKVTGSGILFDDKKQVFQVEGSEDAAKFVPTIPKTERTKIEAALKRAGKPADDATIMRLYKAKNGL